MKIGDIFYFDDEYCNRAAWCNQNGCHIEEIERDEKGRRFAVVENERPQLCDIIRARREGECFSFVNRGKVWYDTLTSSQEKELATWYQSWLDAPQTQVVPTKPKWLN